METPTKTPASVALFADRKHPDFAWYVRRWLMIQAREGLEPELDDITFRNPQWSLYNAHDTRVFDSFRLEIQEWDADFREHTMLNLTMTVSSIVQLVQSITICQDSWDRHYDDLVPYTPQAEVPARSK
jgi:hypothetical protein